MGWRNCKMIYSYASYVRYYLHKPVLLPSTSDPSITVSFTTYPAREKWLPIVVGSIVHQSKKPNRIVLYLSEDQFPDTKSTILTSLEKQGVLIKLKPDDMCSHKKYLYAMQEYPDDIIVTIDDDIIYDRNLIKDLFESYKRHPHAVSGKRVHKIRFDSNGKPKPYHEWDIATYKNIDSESTELVATGCGGVLYPPRCLDKSFCNVEAIKSTCMYADDLWLKVMELLNGFPVVLAKSENYKLIHVWNTECDGLALENIGSKGNDVQLSNICNYYNVDLFSLVKDNCNYQEVLR